MEDDASPMTLGKLGLVFFLTFLSPRSTFFMTWVLSGLLSQSTSMQLTQRYPRDKFLLIYLTIERILGVTSGLIW